MQSTSQFAVVVATASLGAGGAERVLCWLANRLQSAGHRVAIVRLESSDRPVFYPLDPAIEIVSLGMSGGSSGLLSGILANLRRVLRLRATFAALKPGRILGFGTETNVLCLLASLGRWTTVVAERSDPNSYPASRLWRRLRDVIYPIAAKVVFQTETARQCLSSRLDSVVIPNPVLAPLPPNSKDPEPEPRDLVAMGRLGQEKGFDVLLDAMARLPPRFADVTLRILGEGEARPELEAQAARLGLAGRVEMKGLVANPTPYLRAARIFVLPSRFEGFPNALCEAMALGLPAIASNCMGGPAEIVRDGIDGLLTPPGDADALAAAIAGLLDDGSTRAKFAENAKQIIHRYSADNSFEKWAAAIRAE